jgi:hypothetical protein
MAIWHGLVYVSERWTKTDQDGRKARTSRVLSQGGTSATGMSWDGALWRCLNDQAATV